MRWVIPDIHGCSETLKKLLDTLNISSSDQIYFLGDYIDRGPDSKGVLDIVMEGTGRKYMFPIIGNHEDWLLTFHYGDYHQDDFNNWKLNGGAETLVSFGIEKAQEIPQEYIDFILNLPKIIQLNDYVLVHGGLNLYLSDPIKGTAESDMMWERPYGEESQKYWPFPGKKLIVGHTTRTRNQILRYIEKNNNVLMLDNGCVYRSIDRNKGKSNLVAFNLDDHSIVWMPRQDKVSDFW